MRPFNSFLGNREVIKAMVGSKKALLLATPRERLLLQKFGSVILGIFGWPLRFGLRHVYRTIFRYLGDEQPGRILDVGCSYGTCCFEMARRGWQVIGIEIDEENIRLGKEIKKRLKVENVSFVHGDFLSNSFPSEVFDAILMSDVLEHLQDDEGAIKEASRVLKFGGILIISTPYSERVEEYDEPKMETEDKQGQSLPDDLFIGGYHWRSGYNKERLAHLLENRGFNILSVSHLRLPMMLPESEFLFPITYPLSFITPPSSREGSKIVVKAKKGR